MEFLAVLSAIGLSDASSHGAYTGIQNVNCRRLGPYGVLTVMCDLEISIIMMIIK